MPSRRCPRLRQQRREPSCAQRMVGWLAHAQIADEGERLYRIEYAQRRVTNIVVDRWGHVNNHFWERLVTICDPAF